MPKGPIVPGPVKVRAMAGRPSQPLKNPPNRIREVRESKGLTLREVGNRAGFSEQVVQRYETGENKIRVWQLERIARALGVPAYALMNDCETGLHDATRTLLAIFRRLSPSAQRRAVRLLAALEADDHDLAAGQ